jgi:hypothetical protein
LGKAAEIIEKCIEAEKKLFKSENPRVGGSTPSLATIKINKLGLLYE